MDIFLFLGELYCFFYLEILLPIDVLWDSVCFSVLLLIDHTRCKW
jgi:hypothetical protein